MNALQAIVVVLALATSPVEYESAARCDILEVNEYWDENGKHLLDQLLAWSWSAETGRYELREWKLLKDPIDYPKEIDGDWEARWSPNRLVRAKHIKFSAWQFDVELVERKNTPREERVPLFGENPMKPGSDPLPPAPPAR